MKRIRLVSLLILFTIGLNVAAANIFAQGPTRLALEVTFFQVENLLMKPCQGRSPSRVEHGSVCSLV